MKSSALMGYGKIPSKGDFLKINMNNGVLRLFDEWASAGIAQLMESSPNWKESYDKTTAIPFFITHTRGKKALAGAFSTSQDQAGRRYPFFIASHWELDEEHTNITTIPTLMSYYLRVMDTAEKMKMNQATEAKLQEVQEKALQIMPSSSFEGAYQYFLNNTTIENFQKYIPTNNAKLRNIFAGMGLILHPLLFNKGGKLYRLLALPIPDDPIYGLHAVRMYMEMLAPFLRHLDQEFSVFFHKRNEQWELVINLSDLSARVFQLLIANTPAESIIDFSDTPWVEVQAVHQFAAQALWHALTPKHTLAEALHEFNHHYNGSN